MSGQFNKNLSMCEICGKKRGMEKGMNGKVVDHTRCSKIRKARYDAAQKISIHKGPNFVK